MTFLLRARWWVEEPQHVLVPWASCASPTLPDPGAGAASESDLTPETTPGVEGWQQAYPQRDPVHLVELNQVMRYLIAGVHPFSAFLIEKQLRFKVMITVIVLSIGLIF